jgi:hypothetical protein
MAQLRRAKLLPTGTIVYYLLNSTRKALDHTAAQLRAIECVDPLHHHKTTKGLDDRINKMEFIIIHVPQLTIAQQRDLCLRIAMYTDGEEVPTDVIIDTEQRVREFVEQNKQ